MRIAFIISSLSIGGAERVLVSLAEGFSEKGHEVTVVTLSGKDADFYRLSNEVHRLALGVTGNSHGLLQAFLNNIHRLRMIRRSLRSSRPDLVVSFIDQINVLTILSLTGTGCPVIATEHCDSNTFSCGAAWETLRRLTYRRAAKIVSVSCGVNQSFDWLPEGQRVVIYNPLTDVDEEQAAAGLPAEADVNKKWLISMGRLTHQKGFDLLLLAFQKIAHKHPDWQLLILGEGALRAELENLRDRLGLSHRALFIGQIPNPFPILKRSELFVMSSRFEGFGNVLVEAMACGLPVISTDCPSGPREIIRDGVDGILVPNGDEQALAAAMDRLMSDEKERKRLGERAPEVSERFGMEKIMGMWEELFDRVLEERS